MKKLSVLLALLMLLSALPMISPGFAEGSDYTQTLFDQSKPIEIDIQMDGVAWDHMIATAEDEEYSACDLVVNGVLYENVAIRPKGNSSLSSVKSQGSERFSWRIKFDKYEKKRTCDGLDILILNNGFKDPGELREALAYDMYAFLDADASLYNYAIVSVNGEYFGCYLALEGVDKSFAKRNYGEDYGKLYKPEITNMGKRNNQDNDQPADGDGNDFGASFGGRTNGTGAPTAPDQGVQPDNGQQPTENGDNFGGSSGGSAGGRANGDGAAPDQNAQPEGETEASADGGNAGGSFGGQRPNAPAEGEESDGASRGGGFALPGMGGGAKSESELAMALNYVGDDLEAYQGIWDSAKFKSEEEDYVRVVEAIKHVCQGDGIPDYLNVDNVLKYFAIQTFIYNHDGLTGTVSHNYYLYEEDGKLNLIPWDMNESFTVSGNGSDYVNFPIDTPFMVDDLSQRSFFMALLENEECLEKYHEYLRQLSEEYALGGTLEETILRLRGMIDARVKDDPTAFSTYDQYDAAAQSLKTVIQLRAESVLGQISGEIPSTREGQSAEPDKLLDTSGADLSGLTNGFGMGKMNFTMPQIPGNR